MTVRPSTDSVVVEIEAFCERHGADLVGVKLTGLRFLSDDTMTDGINAALNKRVARSNGTDPTR